jgi:hypothetical protein
MIRYGIFDRRNCLMIPAAELLSPARSNYHRDWSSSGYRSARCDRWSSPTAPAPPGTPQTKPDNPDHSRRRAGGRRYAARDRFAARAHRAATMNMPKVATSPPRLMSGQGLAIPMSGSGGFVSGGLHDSMGGMCVTMLCVIRGHFGRGFLCPLYRGLGRLSSL